MIPQSNDLVSQNREKLSWNIPRKDWQKWPSIDAAKNELSVDIKNSDNHKYQDEIPHINNISNSQIGMFPVSIV